MRKNINTQTKVLEYLFIAFFCLSFAFFCFGSMMYSSNYKNAVDIVDGGYSPFASEHALTLFTFSVLAVFGLVKLWLRGRSIPPLLFVFALIFVLIGVAICFAVLLQISSNTEFYDGWLFGFLPVTYIVAAITVISKSVVEEATLAPDKIYRNKFLNYLNRNMANAAHQPYYIIILLLPAFVTTVAILMLFGQDANSITKVFTETTTWNFSAKTHPPFLDHKGHYLCTIAVCGDPEVVKPIRLGRRHGHEIIVNRQLLIANAFEELIEEGSPAIHKIIRSIYDKYGYPLSKKITSPSGSNLIYRLMKPLEYFFLITLYFCCEKPEEKIAKQYSNLSSHAN